MNQKTQSSVQNTDHTQKRKGSNLHLEVAERFSLEKNARYVDKWNGQFGFHDIEKTDISGWKPPKKEFNLDWDQLTMQVKSRGRKYNEYPPTIAASALKLSKDERKRL